MQFSINVNDPAVHSSHFNAGEKSASGKKDFNTRGFAFMQYLLGKTTFSFV